MLCSGSVPRQRMELGPAGLVSGTENCPTQPQSREHWYFLGCPGSTLRPHSFPLLPGYPPPLLPYVHTHILHSQASIPIFQGILVEGSVTDLARVTAPVSASSSLRSREPCSHGGAGRCGGSYHQPVFITCFPCACLTPYFTR